MELTLLKNRFSRDGIGGRFKLYVRNARGEIIPNDTYHGLYYEFDPSIDPHGGFREETTLTTKTGKMVSITIGPSANSWGGNIISSTGGATSELARMGALYPRRNARLDLQGCNCVNKESFVQDAAFYILGVLKGTRKR